jgi:hypothetical protein
MALAQVQGIIRGLEMGRDRFVFGLEKTPDDRLAWSPGEGARTPLELAGTVAGFAGFMLHVCREAEMPERPAQPPPAPASREEAQAAVTGALNNVIAYVSGMTEADLAKLVPVPWGQKIPAGEFAGMFGTVLGYFQGQLNYLQVCYGDKDPNIPPSWFPQAQG